MASSGINNVINAYVAKATYQCDLHLTEKTFYYRSKNDINRQVLLH